MYAWFSLITQLGKLIESNEISCLYTQVVQICCFYICSWALCGGFDKIALCKQCILVDNGKPWGHFFYNLHFQCLTKALTEAETGAIVVYLSQFDIIKSTLKSITQSSSVLVYSGCLSTAWVGHHELTEMRKILVETSKGYSIFSIFPP